MCRFDQLQAVELEDQDEYLQDTLTENNNLRNDEPRAYDNRQAHISCGALPAVGLITAGTSSPCMQGGHHGSHAQAARSVLEGTKDSLAFLWPWITVGMQLVPEIKLKLQGSFGSKRPLAETSIQAIGLIALWTIYRWYLYTLYIIILGL